MKTGKNKARLFGLLLTLSVAGSLWSCIKESYSDCPDPLQDKVALNLHLVTQSPSTRTRAMGHETEKGTDPENHINISDTDFQVLIFDADGRLIEYFEPTTKGVLSSNSDYTIYSLAGRIAPVSDKIRVMVLANWKSFDAASSYSGFQIPWTLDLNDLYTDGLRWNFTMPVATDNATSEKFSWRPAITPEARLIPMFGVSVEVDLTVLSKENPVISLTGDNSIKLLRSIAKIEVIDNIEGSAIESVSLSKYNTTGRFIPNVKENPEWNNNKTQVTTPSLPTNETDPAGRDLVFFNMNAGSGAKAHWVAYVPEMRLGDKELIDTRPHLDLTIDKRDYRLEFADYNSRLVPDSGWPNLLRNHIYQYTVNSVGAAIELTLNVLPWDLAEDEIWYYEDIPGSADPIVWTQYGALDNGNATVTLNVSNDVEKILKGQFTIPSPLSGIWHAQLMTVGDAKPTAIMFCNADGSPIDPSSGQTGQHVWGLIRDIEDPTKAAEATIYIKVETTGVDIESRFRLMVSVQNGERWMEVTMTPGSSESNFWTIIRPTNAF